MNKNNLKEGFDSFLGVGTIVKRKRRTKVNQKKVLFISTIKQYEAALDNSLALTTTFGIDLSSYEDPFYQVIDNLLILGYGKEIYELISFYFYERINPDGTENFFVNPITQEEMHIRTPEELYDLIVRVFPNTFI